MKNVREFTDANFQTEVLDSDRPVLVDFWAPWCGPCRALGPTIGALAEEYGDSVKVGKLNVDDNPISASGFGISSIPAVFLFENGKIVEKFVGVQPKERFEAALQGRVAA